MLLVGQSAKAAADDGMFPKVFARLNRHGVPGPGLVIVGDADDVVLFATMSPTIAGQFGKIIDLAVILVVIPYIYASVAVVKVVHDHGSPTRTFQTFKWIAIAAVAYCLWTVVGGDPRHGGERDGGAPDQRPALSVLHPLDGGGRTAEGRSPTNSLAHSSPTLRRAAAERYSSPLSTAVTAGTSSSPASSFTT